MMTSENDRQMKLDRTPQETGRDIMSCIDHLLSSFAALCSSNDPSQQLANLDLNTVAGLTREILRYVHTLQNQSLPVMQLPPEVLGIIFEMLPFKRVAGRPSDIRVVNSQLPDRPTGDWMKVRLVCRRWHDVAASHDALWTTIFGRMGDRRLSARQAQLELFRLFLKNSRHAPLNISLTDMLSASPEDTSALTEALEPHIPRMRELGFTLPETPSPDVLRLLTHSSAPILQGLDLDLHLYLRRAAVHNLPTSLPALFQDNTPALRCLSVCGFLSSAKYNFRNLRQLKLSGLIYRDNWTGLVDMMNSSPTLEDLMFCGPVWDLGFPAPAAITPHLYLPSLRKLVFNQTDHIFQPLLSQCDIPLNVYVYGTIRPSLDDANDSFYGFLRRCGSHLQDISKLQFVSRNGYNKVYASGKSFALQFRKTRSSAAPMTAFFGFTAELLGRVQELWVDGFCPVTDDILAPARNITKLYCASGGSDWLSALRHLAAASLGGDLPCPLLREIHLLQPELVPAIAEMVGTRHAQGCPLDKLYFYLPLTPEKADADDRGVDEREAEVLRTLQPWVRIEFVRTDTLPRMQVPAHCTVQSGGGWDWPTWDAKY